MTDSKWMKTMVEKLGTKENVRLYMSGLASKQKGTKKPNSGTASLSPEERSKRGKAAAAKRWSNQN